CAPAALIGRFHAAPQLTVRGHLVRHLALLSAVVVLAIAACVSEPHVKRVYWQHRLDHALPAVSHLAQGSGFFERARIEHGYHEPGHTLYGIERDASSFFVVSYGIE